MNTAPRSFTCWLISWVLLSCITFFTGCAAVQTTALLAHPPADLPVAVELDTTPFFAQTSYQCGPAALATAMNAVGIETHPDQLAERIFLPARQGTLQTEMLVGARRGGAIATRIPANIESLLRELAARHPVVVLQNLGLSFAPVWHYAVAIGYDLTDQTLLLRSGTERRQTMTLNTFEHTWKRSAYWAFVVTPPGQWPATADESAVVEAAVGFERVAQPAQAETVYASALKRWPDNLTLAIGLGNVVAATGDPARAAELFRRAAIQHRSTPAWLNYANLLLELHQAPAALEAARQAQAIDDPVWRAQTAESIARIEAALR